MMGSGLLEPWNYGTIGTLEPQERFSSEILGEM